MAVITVQRIVLLIGVILCVLGAFGVALGPADVFQVGVAVCFASWLVP
jgi:hypothetical protein